ncbi:MAG: hypothetical protein U0353_32585 [Sandaracinus sp.]
MRASLPRTLAFVGIALSSLFGATAVARADCPPGAPAHDVAYMCRADAPYLDYVGVCTAENTGYYCGTSCTVCFCGASFSLRTPCPASDAGTPDAGGSSPPACTSSCGPCAEGSAGAFVLPWAPLLALGGAWRRRRAR